MSARAKDTNLAKEIGKRIKDRRTAIGLSRSDLARVSCLSRDAIARFERGERVPNQDSRRELCDAFDTTEEELFGEYFEKPKPPIPKHKPLSLSADVDLDEILRQEKKVDLVIYSAPYELRQRLGAVSKQSGLSISKLCIRILDSVLPK